MAKILSLIIVMAVAAFITAMVLRKDIRFDVLNFFRRIFLRVSKNITESLDKPQERPVVIDKDPNRITREDMQTPTVTKDGEVKHDHLSPDELADDGTPLIL